MNTPFDPVQSAIVLMRELRRSPAIVVIGGVDVVSRLRVIICLPCISRLDRGRL
jgi:hypothetical protein